MALITVHKIMITTAVLFCGLFAVRGFLTGDSVTGGVFAFLTLGLAGYFRWFLTKKAEAEE